jgi:hypothetical protein
MTEGTTALQQAEARLEQAEGALNAIGRVLENAEKARAAAERAHSAVRSGNMLLFAGIAAFGALLLTTYFRRGTQPVPL